ncbi:MAG: methionyl-tRNA formyltransferase [Pseudohongiellaceae bacterium]|jgi:methionyl-tRNA formyltransferase
MKIAYFGYNAFSSCLDLLISSGHEVIYIYTGENSVHTDKVISLSTLNQIPLSFDKPDKKQMDGLVSAGVDLFLSAEYPWRIPVPDELKYAINIHPTMLPEGRGPTPIPLLLLAYPQHAGITLHKMTNNVDEGDILLQKTIMIDDCDSFDTLSAKLYIEIPLLLNKLLSNLNHYYKNGMRQGKGTSWEKLSQEDQTINWNRPTAKVLQQIRAFGSLGVYSELQGQRYLITAAEGVICQHNIKAGDIISIDEMRLVIASNDGLISMPRSCLTSLLSLGE